MINLGEHPLSIRELISVARFNEKVQLSEEARQLIIASNQRLQSIINRGKPVYGINTGFGIFADQRIPANDCAKLSRNLILSHSVGTGDDLPEEVVRAAMLVRANTLAKGFSGVRLEVVQTLLDMINEGITPVVPSQGSLGSSGDLCPLSHMALVFTTDEEDLDEQSGKALYRNKIMSGKKAMEQAGIKRVILGPKEGLAINNGATFSAAIAAISLWDGKYLVEVGEANTAMTLEALQGCSAAFDSRIHLARGQQGQIESAQHIRELIAGSTFVDSTDRVQDAYSLRCSPQVHGGIRDTIRFAWTIIEAEINAATDNPLIFTDSEAISGGNFHGEPIGLVMDYLGIAMAEVGAISERRTFRLTDGKLNGKLPPMLVGSEEAAGLNSGLMMPQYTAVSLVLENQTLATPDSVHSLPTSGEQEDHNANAMTASRHTYQIIQNVTHILSVELFSSCQAIDLRMRKMNAKLGKGTNEIFKTVRQNIPFHAVDQLWGPDIRKIGLLIHDQKLLIEKK